MKQLLFLIVFFISVYCQAQGAKNVSAQEFNQLVSNKKYVLIDLRTNPEIDKKGMIEGARVIDFLAKDAEKQITGLDKTKTYLIYCAGGGRSSECLELMQANGFANVINLEKGFDDWKSKGYKIIKK